MSADEPLLKRYRKSAIAFAIFIAYAVGLLFYNLGLQQRLEQNLLDAARLELEKEAGGLSYYFYGSGALPINYPNILDSKRGKTGSGIWLHGTPPNQFSRPPLATDGCVVLANPDLDRLIRTIEVRTTPVVIATQLQWIAPHSIRTEGKPFEDALHAWRNAKTSGNLGQILAFYTPDFSSNGKTLEQWTPTLKTELANVQGRTIQLKDVSYLRWTDAADTMVVTFGEVADGTKTGLTKRQYWMRQGTQWKIFFEGTL